MTRIRTTRTDDASAVETTSMLHLFSTFGQGIIGIGTISFAAHAVMHSWLTTMGDGDQTLYPISQIISNWSSAACWL
jgi:hypothetical protein